MKQKAIFISHNSKDKPFVRRLSEALANYGISSWVDESEIRFGESLINKISDAIEKIDLVVAIISKDSVQSTWVRQELEWAMTKEINKRKVVIIPLLINKCDIPFFLANKLYADFTDSSLFGETVKKLVESIYYHRGKTYPEESKDNEKYGESVAIRFNPTNIPMMLSILLIITAIIIMIATHFYSRSPHIINNFNRLKESIYTFALLIIGLQLAEIIRLLFIRYLIKIDPGFANESGMIRITSLFSKRYRKLILKYWSRDLIKVSVFFEVGILLGILILINYAVKIISFL